MEHETNDAERRMTMPVLFMCDPSKNKKCKKTTCIYRNVPEPLCYRTKDESCARLDENGRPIVAGEEEEDGILRGMRGGD